MVSAVLESAATWIYQVIQSHGKMWLTLFSVTIPRDLGVILSARLLAHAAIWRIRAGGGIRGRVGARADDHQHYLLSSRPEGHRLGT